MQKGIIFQATKDDMRKMALGILNGKLKKDKLEIKKKDELDNMKNLINKGKISILSKRSKTTLCVFDQ